MAWHERDFLASLTSVAPRTVEAYAGDLAGFVEWAERGGVAGPGRRRPHAAPSLRRPPRHAPLRQAVDRPEGVGRCVATSRGRPAPGTSPAIRRAASPRRAGDGRLPRVLRQDELTALLDDPPAAVADDDPAIRARDDAVLELLYGSGLRVGELCALGPADLDLDRGRATVWGKGGKQRAVPLSDPAVDALRRVARRAAPLARRRRRRRRRPVRQPPRPSPHAA